MRKCLGDEDMKGVNGVVWVVSFIYIIMSLQYMDSFDEESLGKVLISQLKENKDLNEVISIVEDNSEGGVFLIGGMVSRTLADELYGGGQVIRDYDFVVEKLSDDISVPEGWKVSFHKFGNPTLKKGDVEIDIFPLSDHEYIKKNKLEPTITNFLAGVPFSVQALAFDVKHEKLIGKDGIESLRIRKFKVHNVESAKEVARRKGVSINERMKQKADSMGFGIIPFD